MSTVVVDWLGRGGIAQCSEAWAIELDRSGEQVVVATRAGRELADSPLTTVLSQPHGGRLRTHRRLVRTVSAAIRDLRPDAVVVQNFLVAPLDDAVHRAARAVGARLVLVVHDHQHHTRTSGLRFGLARQLRRADVVVAHSEFVATSLGGLTDRPVTVIPLPLPLGLLDAPRPTVAPIPPDPRRTALHLGVLTRSENKGTPLVMDLAGQGVADWRFVFAGVGSPSVAGAVSLNRFLTPGELASTIEASSAVLLPYRFASQSGVVPVAQALGAVPIVTDVGGLTEQVADGVTGLVLSSGADVDALRNALERLDDRTLGAMAEQGQLVAWERHRTFAARIGRLE